MPARVLRVALGLTLTLSAALGTQTAPAVAAGMPVDRLAGVDRYATASAISSAHFAPGVPVAFVATGVTYPDALAAGPAAALAGGPILLVSRDAIPAATDAELRRLRPTRIVILGLEGAIGSGVEGLLAQYQTGGGVTRLGGADRYGTAAAISAAHFAPGVAAAYVATGATFPDALTGGVAAARAGGPLLLTPRDVLAPGARAELERLAPSRIVVIGGSGAVSDAVVAELRALTPSGRVDRLAGSSRYDTATAVSRDAFPTGASAIFVATGRNFPDAMVAVPVAARSDAPLLLSDGGAISAAVIAEAQRLSPERVVLLGGTRVVSERANLELRVALGDLPPLPACAYADVLTARRDYADWAKTLLDTTYMVEAQYHPTDLVDTSRAGLNGGYGVRSHVVPDLAALAQAASAAGAPFRVVSGFRSHETQEATFARWVAVRGLEQALRTSARPGHSEHQLGTTFDFASLNGPLPWDLRDWGATLAGSWLRDNAWRFGFVMSYPPDSFDRVCYSYEPWHYRYVGREVAKLVVESGLTLREWLWLSGSGA